MDGNPPLKIFYLHLCAFMSIKQLFGRLLLASQSIILCAPNV
jgi:hypothetical protein